MKFLISVVSTPMDLTLRLRGHGILHTQGWMLCSRIWTPEHRRTVTSTVMSRPPLPCGTILNGVVSSKQRKRIFLERQRWSILNFNLQASSFSKGWLPFCVYSSLENTASRQKMTGLWQNTEKKCGYPAECPKSRVNFYEKKSRERFDNWLRICYNSVTTWKLHEKLKEEFHGIRKAPSFL